MLGKFFKSSARNKNKPAMEDRAELDDPLFRELDLDSVTIVPRDGHSISRKNISPSALKVLYKLDAEGFQAFLVGGSVRDILMGNAPKDFDIATNATPEQIRGLFRNSRIIGRRFKIVHIRYGREVIEVTTFRAHHDPGFATTDRSRKSLKDTDSALSSTGMILRDNVYGDLNEDAVRRDFTVNALYYTVRGFLLLDFSTGLADIENCQIRIIGDAATRYREDPVRMLRAIRFSAKLDFEIEPGTRQPIDELASSLESVSPARLFDEVMKLLSTGHGEKSFDLLRQYKIGRYLIPATLRCLEHGDEPEQRLVRLALQNTDRRIAEDKSVTPAFLFAALLWPVLIQQIGNSLARQPVSIQDLQRPANQILAEQQNFTAIPKRFTFAVREIWEFQLRLQRRTRKSVAGLVQNPRFRAAYDFLLLREESGEDLGGLGTWWTEFQFATTQQQAEMLSGLTGNTRKRQRPRRRKSRKSE